MARKKSPELVIENTEDLSNLAFLSIIEYKKKQYLCLIDNMTKNELSAFVLDYAEASNVDINEFISTAIYWYYSASTKYPLSFEFSKRGLADDMLKIRRTFRLDFISRLIGKHFEFNIDKKPKVSRRRISTIQSGIEIKLKRINS